MLITGIRFPPFGFAIPEMSSKDADLSLGDYGLPHQRSTVHIVLSKNECKGAAAARKVAQLAKALTGVLPQTRRKDLIMLFALPVHCSDRFVPSTNLTDWTLF